MKNQNKNRRLVLVEVGNVSGGGSPPQGSFTQRVAAIPQALYQGVAQGVKHPGFGPAVVGYAGKKFVDSILSDQIVESSKAFTRGFQGKGFPGALNEMTKTFQHSWLQSRSVEPKDLTPVETGLKHIVEVLTYAERQDLARHIKKEHGAQGLKAVRERIPGIPGNPGLPGIGYLLFFVELVYFLAAFGVLQAFFLGYEQGIKTFNEAVENRGDISVELFILKYYFGWILQTPEGFQENTNNWIINVYNINDDCYTLPIDF